MRGGGVSMTIKSYTTLVLATGVCLALGLVALADGGIRHLFSTKALITVFAISLPFFILWAAANGAKGTAVAWSAIAISITFILLDAAVYVGLKSELSDSTSSVGIGAIASMEMILSLMMVVCALMSCASGESGESNNTE